MQKIIFYIDSMRTGGAQRVMNNLVCHFAQVGYNVVLINDFIDKDKKFTTFDVPSQVKRRYLREDNKGNAILKNIQRIIRLRRIIKEEKADIVLSFLAKPNIRMLTSTVFLSVKKVVSVRNDPNHEYGSGKVKKVFANMLFSLADGVVFQTYDASKYFISSIRNKSTIIYNPVAEKFFDTTWENGNKIITCGRLEEQKNHILLLSAFKKVVEEYPEVNLVIYGEGPLRKELIQYIYDNGLQNRVRLPGNVTDIEKRLKEAMLFVLSSNYEGMPNALMEALSVGVPSISTDCPCGGPRELIKNKVNGILVPCNDASGLAKSIISLIKDRDERIRISKHAKKMAEEYCPEKIYSQWNDYLTKIINNLN